jgi:sugar (pentulose or hexulose) kinase
MAGASSCLNSIVTAPLEAPAITHYSHVVPDVFCTELGINTSGAAIAWAVGALRFDGYEDFAAAASVGRDAVLAAGDPVAAAPVFLPYLGDGERDDVALRGGFVGLSDRHGREALAYAVLEGVALGVAETVGVLEAAGSPCSELRVAGGGARLDVLGVLKADALGVVVRHLEADTAAVGAALLAASAVGHRDEALAAIAAGVERARAFEPSGSEAVAVRREWFERVRGSAGVRV